MESKKRKITFLDEVEKYDKVFKNFSTNFFNLSKFYLKSILREWVLLILLFILMFA